MKIKKAKHEQKNRCTDNGHGQIQLYIIRWRDSNARAYYWRNRVCKERRKSSNARIRLQQQQSTGLDHLGLKWLANLIHIIYMYVVIISTYDVSCATCLLSIHINRLECGLRHRNWTPMMLLCCLLSMFDSLLVSLRLSRRTWPDEFVRIKSDGYWYFHLFLQDVCFQLVNTKKKQTTVLIEAAHRSIVDMAMWPQMIWNTLPMTMNIILVCEVRRPHGSVDLKFTINCNQFITSAAIGIVRLQAGYTTYSTIMHIELAIGNDGPAIN